MTLLNVEILADKETIRLAKFVTVTLRYLYLPLFLYPLYPSSPLPYLLYLYPLYPSSYPPTGLSSEVPEVQRLVGQLAAKAQDAWGDISSQELSMCLHGTYTHTHTHACMHMYIRSSYIGIDTHTQIHMRMHTLHYSHASNVSYKCPTV